MSVDEYRQLFRPSLVDDFLNNVEFRVKYKVSYSKKHKSAILEKELYPLLLIAEEGRAESRLKIFGFAMAHLNIDASEEDIVNLVYSFSLEVSEGFYSATLNDVLKKLDISREVAVTALLVSIGVIYKGRYNKALKKLNDRTVQVDNQGYLDF